MRAKPIETYITKSNYDTFGDNVLVNKKLECLLEFLPNSTTIKYETFMEEGPTIIIYYKYKIMLAEYYEKFDLLKFLNHRYDENGYVIMIRAFKKAQKMFEEKYAWLDEADELGLI